MTAPPSRSLPRPAPVPEDTRAILQRLDDAGLRDIVAEVAARFSVTLEKLVSHDRHKSVAAARQEVWLIVATDKMKSTTELQALFGFDHSTIVRGIQTAKRRLRRVRIAA